jgi:hypothetical protein
MILTFDFKDKSAMSLGDEPDFVIINFWGAPFLLSEDGAPIFSEPFVVRTRVPLLSESGSTSVIATKALAKTVGAAGEAVTWLMFFVRVVGLGAAAEILGVLGYMQLVVYLPLIDVKFPATAKSLYTVLVTVTTFDVLPRTDDWYPPLFGFDEESFEPLSDAFADFDFGSTVFVMNLGSLFFAMTLILVQFILYYIGKGCNGCILGRKL